MKSSELARMRRERGVTLTEAMVALALFAIALAAISSFLVQHVRAAGNNFRDSYAYALAEQEIESVRALGYEAIAPRSSTQTLGGVTYSVVTNVFENSPAANMKTVEVKVGWNDIRGARSVKLATIYTKVRR